MKRRDLVSGLSALLASTHWGKQAWAAGAPSLLPRPRLGVTPSDWSSLEARRSADADLDRLVVLLLERARKDLALAPLERKLEGRRLLGVSREFIRRGLLWSFAFRLTGERAFLDRARQEMLNVAAFSDWHPDHYLDVAEMTAGLAFAYDWLGADLASSDRSVMRTALVNLGIAQARHGHKTFKARNNWNQVCIGGMVLGALAIEEDQPELTQDLLLAARRDVDIGLEAYRPDGVYPEGPGYWDYGTCYSVLLAAALRAGKGTDWGILAAPGFRRSAEFYAHAIGPSGKAFDFADGTEGPGFSCAMVYLAREIEQPALLGFMRQMIRNRQGLSERFAPLAALWWPADVGGRPPRTSFFGQGDQPVAMWRSAWADPDALWFAIKAGGAAHSHAHMDSGSFVLDLDGVRWAKDLGMQDYNSLESRGIDLWNMRQDSARWQVFRLSAQAHNTLTIDGQPHNAGGMATMHMADEREVSIDLTRAFLPGHVVSATRRARFMEDAVVLIDELRGLRADATVRWAMNTEALIQVDGSVAVLSQKGKRLAVQLEGDGMHIEVLDISDPRHDFDVPNPGVKQLVVSGRPTADGTWRLKARFARG